MMRLANMMNGFAYPPYDGVCYFQSCYGHQISNGYFRIDSMPYTAILHLLRGGQITIVDGTRKQKLLSDALKFGVPTWCIVFNRALNFTDSRDIKVCYWQTPEMKRIALNNHHKPLVQTIRKMVKVFGYQNPAIIGENIILECHSNATFDDEPKKLKQLVYGE